MTTTTTTEHDARLFRAARRAATFYTGAWVLAAASWVALPLGAWFFDVVVANDAGQKRAMVMLVVLIVVTWPLPYIADVVQSAALMRVAKGVAPARPTTATAFVVALALLAPLLATGISVGAARAALAERPGAAEGPALPSTWWSTWIVVVVWLAVSTIGTIGSFAIFGDPAPTMPPSQVPSPLVSTGLTVVGVAVVRAILGVKLRAAFAELEASATPIDDMRASRTAPVAG